ncbi:MAG: single-stranded-DNA-specific exonuclease RecJ [Candidatus Pacebacteria bacterium]|nr:single-stranded-DNA-specific exonuclease RecJ [Candidatus Paceibacterota bacterium]
MQDGNDILNLILDKRGLSNEEKDIFLNPKYERDLHDPFLMRDMEKACVRVYEAMEANEKIIIYADYDCDGIPGAVILEDLFKRVGYKNYQVYIPKRNSEGYGLNLEAIDIFRESGVRLIITIDLGITAVEEVAQAEVFGIDTIITDHHLPHEILPRAYAILNPKVDDYPEKMLCGAGVMFKFVQGFLRKYGELFKTKEGTEKWMLDMAGLATLSDMVPLLGENRAISYFGLKVLKKSPRIGFKKLLKKMNINQNYLTEDDVGFMVTPRLNAASRMDDPMRAYELLSTSDEEEAEMLAEHLTEINDERKSIVTKIMRDVNHKFKSGVTSEVIVVGDPSWRIGVLGLVAGKITDEYKRPVFVWGRDENDLIKGSCRSDGSVSVVELMTATSESFVDFGGHELAGGFTVKTDQVHFLEENLSVSYRDVKRLLKENKDKNFDVEADFSILTMKNWKEIEKLSPFGLDNPKPIFLFEKVEINNIKKFGKNGGEHVEITFKDLKGKLAKGVSFFSGVESFSTLVAEKKVVNLLATFDLSRFMGRVELRLRIEDIF